MEYSAASDAYTACPEGFNEFFNQRRRWMPSTIANIFDLLSDYKNVVKVNPDISIFYIAYQVNKCRNRLKTQKIIRFLMKESLKTALQAQFFNY